MEAEDKRLNFSRYDLQAVFQSNHSPGFTPAAQLYCLNSTLPSLQQCWEAAALEATHVTPSPCPATILWPGPNESSLGTEGPHQPPPLPACWQRGLWGQSLQQLPCCHLICREGQQPMETRTQCSHGPDPVPVCGNTHGTSSPASSPLLTRVQELIATGKARTSDSSEMWLYGVYCSKHFIILQWNVLWSAKYYC